MPDSTDTGPYERAARAYRNAGWLGVLPIGKAAGQKSPPPGSKAAGTSWTGHGAPYPAPMDIEAWLAGPEAAFNVGLRAPDGVIGLDVDHYGAKDGGDKIAALERQWGPLPETWVSSARPAPSGIRWYRVPTVLDGHPINWPGEAAKFIEIIQAGHRYAVAPPSINPEAAGAAYEWRAPADAVGALPSPDALPWLPEPWVRGLALDYARSEKLDLAAPDARRWLAELRAGAPCPPVASVLGKVLTELGAADGSRHEATRDAAAALARFGGEGHHGAGHALAQLGTTFEAAIGADRAAGGEWSRLLSGAVALAAGKNPTPLAHCSHDTLPGLPAEMIADFSVPEPAGSPAVAQALATADPGALTLPDEFWDARESLGRVRQAAHSRVRSGDVVFYGMLARLAAMAPHTLRADTGVATPASLNLFAAIVGPSGGGKSSGLSVSRDLVKATRDLEEFPLGSGEGMAESYMGEAVEGTGEMAKDGSEKTAKVRKQVRHNVLFHSDEGNSLNKLIERAGSTVGETLRSAWSGETIGQKNGRVETTRTVPARSYSAGLLIGYQPTTALPLLDDFEAGTPQRFLYAWAVDPSIPGRQQRVPWPGEIVSPFPAHVPVEPQSTGLGTLAAAPFAGDLTPITFDEAITEELYDLEHAKNTGSLPADHPLRDPFRSQHPVLKVKVSSLLALLEGRRHVVAEDWRLAQIVIDTSDRVRIYLQALARDAAGKARAAHEAAEGALEAHREHARISVASALETAADRRVAVRVAVVVHEQGPSTVAAVRRKLAHRDRPAVEAAVEHAAGMGWVILDGEAGRVTPGGSVPAV